MPNTADPHQPATHDEAQEIIGKENPTAPRLATLLAFKNHDPQTLAQRTPLTAALAQTAANLLERDLQRRRIDVRALLENPNAAAHINAIRAIAGWAGHYPNEAIGAENATQAFLNSHRLSQQDFLRRQRGLNAQAVSNILHLNPRAPAPNLHPDAKPALNRVIDQTTKRLHDIEAADRYAHPKRDAAQHWNITLTNILARMLLHHT